MVACERCTTVLHLLVDFFELYTTPAMFVCKSYITPAVGVVNFTLTVVFANVTLYTLWLLVNLVLYLLYRLWTCTVPAVLFVDFKHTCCGCCSTPAVVVMN